MERIKELQQALNISDKALEARRKKFRMKGGDADAALLRWLEATYEEYRDKVRLLGRQIDYSETFAGAMHIRGVEGEQEPESVPEAYQTLLSAEATAVFEVLKGEEKLKKQAKARAERLRQAELALRRQGKSPDHYLRAVEEAVKAMKDEAKAA